MPIKHLWFGRNNGSHLFYGESGAYGRIFGEVTAWAAADGHPIAAMSDPNKFAAGADASGISISPRVTIKVTWNARWFYLAALALCFVAWRLQQGRRLRLQSDKTPAQSGRREDWPRASHTI